MEKDQDDHSLQRLPYGLVPERPSPDTMPESQQGNEGADAEDAEKAVQDINWRLDPVFSRLRRRTRRPSLAGLRVVQQKDNTSFSPDCQVFF
ncbi:MAG: hypothetical protein IKC53_10840 [Lentisphaeria bacterium]|nr:hypothetical protein [Lentisphaeria bacterium]